MRHVSFLCILLFSACVKAQAQSALQFTVNQLPLLVANAGKDTTVAKGSQVKIGGQVPASGGSGTYSYAWLPATGLDRTDIGNPTATVDADVTYTLTVNDGKGCSKSSTVTLKTTIATGLDPVVLAIGLQVFPNPAKSTFYIRTEHIIAERSLLIEVFDIQGKKIYAQTVSGNRRLNQPINLDSQARGLYILKLTSTKLNSIHKLLIQ